MNNTVVARVGTWAWETVCSVHIGARLTGTLGWEARALGQAAGASQVPAFSHGTHVTSPPEPGIPVTQQRDEGAAVGVGAAWGALQAASPEARARGPGSPAGSGHRRWADPRRAEQRAVKIRKIQPRFLAAGRENT